MCASSRAQLYLFQTTNQHNICNFHVTCHLKINIRKYETFHTEVVWHKIELNLFFRRTIWHLGQCCQILMKLYQRS